MSRIAGAFEEMKRRGRKAFVGYAMVGYPDAAASMELARGLLKAGADLLELGVPFSDPLADGPVIQKAAQEALGQGTTLAACLEAAATLRRETDKPLLLMTYFNPVLRFGVEEFAQAASQAGLDGAIVPDLPPEEAGPLGQALAALGLNLILLAAPNSTPARLKKIAQAASGFIYFVSVTGVTGGQKGFDAGLAASVAALRRVTRLPLAVGFGVSDAARAREAAGLAEAVVAASAVLRPFQEPQGSGPALERALQVAREIIGAVHQA